MKIPAIKISELSKLAKVPLPKKLPTALPMPRLNAAHFLPVRSAVPGSTPRAALANVARAPVWRALTKPFRIIPWRIIAAALCGIGILHIIATLAAPNLALSTAYDRLNGVLPANEAVILPPVTPLAQPLPFMSPALRYAMCRFDTANGSVDVSVELTETGSSLTIYNADGEAVYTAAQSEVPHHRVRIVPADGRFLGLSPEARGVRSNEIPSATLHSKRGIIVYATPDLGAAYQTATEQQLAAVSCKPSRPD